MDYHQNARPTIYSRELLARRVVEHGLALKLAAASFNAADRKGLSLAASPEAQGEADE